MKKFIVLFLFILFTGTVAQGQAKKLEVYYIAHDKHEAEITDILEQVRRNARYNPERKVIFYLASGNRPVFMTVGPDDETNYLTFRGKLNEQTSHNVYPEVDRLMLIDLLSKGLSTKGLDAYERVVFNYYITPGFVALNYCDALIGRLYWDMELDKMPRNKLEINIFYSQEDKINEDKLFGRKNLMKNFPILVDSF